MSLTRNVLLILAVICLTGSNARRVKTAKGDTVCVCTMDYRPVCDTAGTMYANLCDFECARDKAMGMGRAALTLRKNGGACS